MPDGTPDDLEFDAFASSLDEMLERVSSTTRAEQEARDREWPAPVKRLPHPSAEAKSIPMSAPATARTSVPPASPVDSAVSAKPHDRGKLAWGVVALVAIGAVFAWAALRFESSPASSLALEQLPPPAAGLVRALASSDSAIAVDVTPLPAIASDPDASTETVMLQQLRQGSATNTANGTPSFAIARYDSLPAASQGWEVLVPLGVEEVYALVPVTSRLRELDDLRGRRINIGESGSPLAESAEALYRALFGQSLPAAPLRAASRDVALPAPARRGSRRDAAVRRPALGVD